MKKNIHILLLALLALVVISCQTKDGDKMMKGEKDMQPADASVMFYLLDDSTAGMSGEPVGYATFLMTENGLKIKTQFQPGTAEGEHGFHIHAGTSIAPAEKNGKLVPGLSAKGHYDPENTGKHEGPEGQGHMGDLPLLKVVDGVANNGKALVAPRITNIDDLTGKAVIIHLNGDNYSDSPASLGGGGARLLGGIISKGMPKEIMMMEEEMMMEGDKMMK